ncbi:MAG: metal-dependent hydrolase [Archaeoglobaceae archaeon]
MNRLGHLGFSLLVFSPLLKFFPISYVLFVIALAMLPDIDLVLRVEHRKYTHNVTFAFLTAVLSYVLLASFLLATLAFLSVSLHILSDLMTKQKFAPLYPFSQKKFALKLFRSDNKPVNYVVFFLGLLSFVHFSNVEVSFDLVRFI